MTQLLFDGDTLYEEQILQSDAQRMVDCSMPLLNYHRTGYGHHTPPLWYRRKLPLPNSLTEKHFFPLGRITYQHSLNAALDKKSTEQQ